MTTSTTLTITRIAELGREIAEDFPSAMVGTSGDTVVVQHDAADARVVFARSGADWVATQEGRRMYYGSPWVSWDEDTVTTEDEARRAIRRVLPDPGA